MNSLPSNPRNQEGVCPVCHAPLTQCGGRRKKKVQCPKCREIVVLDPVEPEETPSTGIEMLMTRELAEIKSRLAQLGPLQARVVKIERELAAWKVPVASDGAPGATPPSPDAPIPAGTDELPRATPPPKRSEVKTASALADQLWWRLRYGIGPETAGQLCPFLETARGSRISIIVVNCDPVAREIGAYFQARFSDAEWIGLDLRTESLSAPIEGLALTLSSGPISPAAAAIHRAFAAAHIALSFQIDPAVSGEGITLIVGSPPPPPAEEKREPEVHVGM